MALEVRPVARHHGGVQAARACCPRIRRDVVERREQPSDDPSLLVVAARERLTHDDVALRDPASPLVGLSATPWPKWSAGGTSGQAAG